MAMLIKRDKLSIESRDHLFFHVFTIRGKLVVSNLLEIRQVISDVIDQAHRNVFFDLENCEEIDSSGIGLLSNLYKRALTKHGTMGIIKPSPRVLTVLNETGLSNLLPVFSNVDDVEAHLDDS